MGTGEESTAAKPAAPTASTQETPPTATYPDWTTQMQAYYGAAPPPPFFTSNVASPAPHPYVWGSQHLMPPYGTPIPYPGLYPHGGLYPHPVPPPAPDAAKEIEGKGTDRKERGSTKKSRGNSGNAGLIVGKSGESAKLTSGSGNDGASQSADSGSEGVSQSSDENTNQREVSGTKKKGFNQMLAEGANAQNNDTVGYSGAVVPATVPGNPVGTFTGTNLNMGMDLWNTSPVGTIPLRAATVPPKMVGREGVPADNVWVQQDERELKRQKRKQSNRESARRSRLRKQAECEDLQSKVEILNNENHSLSDELQRLSEECEKLTTENKTLMEELNQLYGPGAVAALQGVSTNMLVQSVHGDGKGQDASIQINNLVSGHPNGSLYNSNSTELASN